MVRHKKMLLIDWERCTGCQTCTYICSFHHEGVFSRTLSRVTVVRQEERGINIPVISPSCDLCGGTPLCAEYCTPGALRWLERTPEREMREKALAEKQIAKLEEILS